MFKKSAKLARRPSDIVLRRLEDRILFDAVPGIAIDGPHEELINDSPAIEQSIDQSENRQQGMLHEIVFVDTSVDGYEDLVDGLLNVDANRQLELVLLEPTKNGVDQITEALSRYGDLDAIHIVSHADDQAFQLGNIWVTGENLDDYGVQLSQWKQSLSENADRSCMDAT